MAARSPRSKSQVHFLLLRVSFTRAPALTPRTITPFFLSDTERSRCTYLEQDLNMLPANAAAALFRSFLGWGIGRGVARNNVQTTFCRMQRGARIGGEGIKRDWVEGLHDHGGPLDPPEIVDVSVTKRQGIIVGNSWHIHQRCARIAPSGRARRSNRRSQRDGRLRDGGGQPLEGGAAHGRGHGRHAR